MGLWWTDFRNGQSWFYSSDVLPDNKPRGENQLYSNSHPSAQTPGLSNNIEAVAENIFRLFAFSLANHVLVRMCSKFMLAKNSHSHRTRGATKNRITLPMVNTGFGQNTFSSRAAKVWNVLPDHMTYDRSFLSFKTSISSLFGKL